MRLVGYLTNYVYVASSLDGFIATRDGGLDWLTEIPNPEESDYGYAEFSGGIDALVMGRKTFEKVLTFDFWPYEKPVFVLSNTLDSVPGILIGKVEIVEGDLKQLVEALKDRGFQNLYIDGGRVIQSFLAEDLIDEMIISWIPILLRKGVPLFGKLKDSLKFSHKKTESYKALVQSHYTRIRG